MPSCSRPSRLPEVQVASELLGLTPPAPLSAILVARPVRVCVVVPAVEGVAWERLVEHALAAQTRVWGGAYNLVVPGGWEIADDELFWRLIDCFDPDLVALHLPTLADVEEISPEKYTDTSFARCESGTIFAPGTRPGRSRAVSGFPHMPTRTASIRSAEPRPSSRSHWKPRPSAGEERASCYAPGRR